MTEGGTVVQGGARNKTQRRTESKQREKNLSEGGMVEVTAYVSIRLNWQLRWNGTGRDASKNRGGKRK